MQCAAKVADRRSRHPWAPRHLDSCPSKRNVQTRYLSIFGPARNIPGRRSIPLKRIQVDAIRGKCWRKKRNVQTWYLSIFEPALNDVARRLNAFQSDFDHLEIFFPGTTIRTSPRQRHVLPASAGRDAVFNVALLLAVEVTADEAHVGLHCPQFAPMRRFGLAGVQPSR